MCARDGTQARRDWICRPEALAHEALDLEHWRANMADIPGCVLSE